MCLGPMASFQPYDGSEDYSYAYEVPAIDTELEDEMVRFTARASRAPRARALSVLNAKPFPQNEILDAIETEGGAGAPYVTYDVTAMQLEAERAHLVLSELARVRNLLAVQTTTDPTPARDAERKRVVTALKELVAAFRDVGADAWFTRDLSWVRAARKRKRSARAAPRRAALAGALTRAALARSPRRVRRWWRRFARPAGTRRRRPRASPRPACPSRRRRRACCSSRTSSRAG